MSERGGQAAAALRIVSDRRTLDEIETRLGLAATQSFARGTRVSARNPRSPRRTHDVWLLDSGLPESAPLDEHLRAVVDEVEPRRDALAECARTTDADWFCMFGAEENGASSRVDRALLARLAALALPLTIDLYPAASTGQGGGDPLERIEVELTALEEEGTTDDAEIVVPFASASGQGTLSLSPQLLRRLARARASLRLELHRFADRA